MFEAAKLVCSRLFINIPSYLLLLFLAVFVSSGASQSYYYGGKSVNGSVLYSNYQEDLHCTDCNILGHGPLMIDYSGGMSFGPDDSLYVINNYPEVSIYQLNTATAVETFIMQGPPNLVKMGGFFAMGGGIFYSVANQQASENYLYKWDVAANTMTIAGELNYHANGDLWQSNGEVYYTSSANNELRFVKINFDDPSNSEVVFTLSAAYAMFGLAPTFIGNIWIGFDRSYFGGVYIVTVNTTDGTVTPKCKLTKSSGSHNSRYMTSIYEHRFNPLWNYLDLDCDDSSLATESDFNALSFDCFTEGGIPISDSDIKSIIDEVITSMTVNIVNPPDGTDEILFSTGDVAGISVSGSETSEIILTNDGGAKHGDFEAALQLIRYDNLAWHLTPGIRNIEVQFETEIGTVSNVATAYLEVIEKPQVEVDLGADLTFCPGETVQLTAGSGQNTYLWSTGETTHAIDITSEGTYSVTVTHVLQCPNFDEIEIVELPQYTISLSGDSSICANQTADLTLNTNADFSVDVEIFIGNQSYWYTITNHVLSFTDLPTGNTEYYINAIVPSEEACMTAEDYDQSIEVYPQYQTQDSTSICNGDSIYAGNTWITLQGDYPVLYQSIHGCDSLVTLHLSVAPIIEIALQKTTCDSTASGIFYNTLINPSGCDTLVMTTVSYQVTDTTFVAASSCRQVDAGTTIQSFVSMAGCDSLVITNILWDPPLDTTLVVQASCDSSKWGLYPLLLTGADGCDSMLITEVVSGQPLIVHLEVTSCDSSSLGVFENHFNGVVHCDSTVIMTVTYAAQDSTFTTSSSCDPAAAGVFYYQFANHFGCDSIVTETVIAFPVQTTNVSSTTCDSTSSGDYVFSLINQFGCDSIVNLHVELLPQNHVFLSETTCRSVDAGTFDALYINQYGCDSIVTRIVTAIPADTTLLTRQTCFQDSTRIQTSLWTNQDGCDSLLILNTFLFPPTIVSLDASSSYNGYEISCYGKQDGNINAIVLGAPPFELLWSTGSSATYIDGLVAGDYILHVKDGNGCVSMDSILLDAPDAILLTTETQQPTCDEASYGNVLAYTSGGVAPYQFSLDGIQFVSSNFFDDVAPGSYILTVVDQNGCEALNQIELEEARDLQVDLGGDHSVAAGTLVNLEARLNISKDSVASVFWSGVELYNCGLCFNQVVSPVVTTSYVVMVESIDGCVDMDSVTIYIKKHTVLDIPNIISPNGDGVNDFFTLSFSADVDEIELVEIFDRWGNLVFSVQHVLAGEDATAWNGTRKGAALDPAVFTYRIIYRLKSSLELTRVGDLTLIR